MGLLIDTFDRRGRVGTVGGALLRNLNTSAYLYIPTLATYINHRIRDFPKHQFWVTVHFVKPKEMVLNAIYRVTIYVMNIVSRISIEVPSDNDQSSSVYRWNHLKSFGYACMTVNKAFNIILESNNSITNVHRDVWTKKQCLFSILFMRHYIYNERIAKDLAGQVPEQSDFTFHNQR